MATGVRRLRRQRWAASAGQERIRSAIDQGDGFCGVAVMRRGEGGRGLENYGGWPTCRGGVLSGMASINRVCACLGRQAASDAKRVRKAERAVKGGREGNALRRRWSES